MTRRKIMLTLQQMVTFLDLTSLNDHDNEATIRQVCQKAKTPLGNVAAVCVYPKFVRLAAELLQDSAIKIATVSNFPQGVQSLSQTVDEIAQAIEDGAHEVDVVMPHLSYLQGEIQYTQNYIAACKSTCDQKTLLKVILETGALRDNSI